MDSFQMIQNWIFEHACNNYMKKVLMLFSDENEWMDHENQSKSLRVPHYTICYAYLKCILECGKHIPKVVYESSTILESLIRILPKVFKYKSFVTPAQFIRLMKWIKLLDLLVALKNRKLDINVRLQHHFPKDIQSSLQEEFDIKEYEDANKQSAKYKAIREYMYQVQLTKDTTEEYFQNSFGGDFQYLVNNIQKQMVKFIQKMSANLLPSPLDQVQNASDELYGCEDSAILLLLENVKPNMDEEDVIRLFKLYRPMFGSQGISLQKNGNIETQCSQTVGNSLPEREDRFEDDSKDQPICLDDKNSSDISESLIPKFSRESLNVNETSSSFKETPATMTTSKITPRNKSGGSSSGGTPRKRKRSKSGENTICSSVESKVKKQSNQSESIDSSDKSIKLIYDCFVPVEKFDESKLSNDHDDKCDGRDKESSSFPSGKTSSGEDTKSNNDLAERENGQTVNAGEGRDLRKKSTSGNVFDDSFTLLYNSSDDFVTPINQWKSKRQILRTYSNRKKSSTSTDSCFKTLTKTEKRQSTKNHTVDVIFGNCNVVVNYLTTIKIDDNVFKIFE